MIPARQYGKENRVRGCMKNMFSVFKLKDLSCFGELLSPDALTCFPAKYIYIAAGQEEPDSGRIRKMLSGVSRSADLILPVPHTRSPEDESWEDPHMGSAWFMMEQFRCLPILSGALIRIKFLMECIQTNRHDWIHSPCPELFFLLFHSMQTQIVRTDYCHTRETLIRFCRQFRKASAWLDGQPLPADAKANLQSRILQYEDYLIDCAVRLELTEKEMELFDPVSIIHNLQTRHPDQLAVRKLPKPEFRPGPVRCLAVFCSALRHGGAERCASLLLQHFSELSGLKLCLFTDSAPAPGDYPCPENIDIVILPRDFYARYVQLPILLKEKLTDTCLFFDHFLTNFYYDLLTARKLGIRTIAMEHNTFAFPLFSADLELLPLRQTIYTGTDLVTCLSRSDEYLWNSQGIKARYMPNPLTFDTSARPPFTERKTKNLIFIARMTRGKGVSDALKTVEKVRERHPEVKLFMLGSFTDPDFERETLDYVQNHRLENSVVFTGFTSDVKKYICLSSIHLMPSAVEGYPMTLMEAKSYGLPTVAYSLPYLEAGKEEYCTLMVPQGDYSAMAEKVSGLLDDFDKLNELGRRAWECLKFFDDALVFRRWQAVFSWLETGEEPDELKLPDHTVEQKLELLRIQTGEITSGIVSLVLSAFNRKKQLNRVLMRRKQEDIRLDLGLKFYFALRKKMESSTPFFMKLIFSVIWRLKRLYRAFRPCQEE